MDELKELVEVWGRVVKVFKEFSRAVAKIVESDEWKEMMRVLNEHKEGKG